jgi:hypothetical protein
MDDFAVADLDSMMHKTSPGCNQVRPRWNLFVHDFFPNFRPLQYECLNRSTMFLMRSRRESAKPLHTNTQPIIPIGGNLA